MTPWHHTVKCDITEINRRPWHHKNKQTIDKIQHFLSSIRPCDVAQGTVTSHTKSCTELWYHRKKQTTVAADDCDITKRYRRLWRQETDDSETTERNRRLWKTTERNRRLWHHRKKETILKNHRKKQTTVTSQKQTTLTPQKERDDSEKPQKETDDSDITETDDCDWQRSALCVPALHGDRLLSSTTTKAIRIVAIKRSARDARTDGL